MSRDPFIALSLTALCCSEVFSQASKKEPKLEYKRVPVNLNNAPREDTFDTLVRLLKSHGSATPVIFNCQGGFARSSTAALMAAIIKEAQLEAEFSKMNGTRLTSLCKISTSDDVICFQESTNMATYVLLCEGTNDVI